MSVPIPNVKPLRIAYGVAHYSYTGEIGTLGPTLVVDLTSIPERIRSKPSFRAQLYVFIQAFDAAANVQIDSRSVTVLPAYPAVPEYLEFAASAADDAGGIQVTVEAHHTIGM
jgi:hypothetical protein